MNNDNNIVRVYLLRDPFTNKIRYVGITNGITIPLMVS